MSHSKASRASHREVGGRGPGLRGLHGAALRCTALHCQELSLVIPRQRAEGGTLRWYTVDSRLLPAASEINVMVHV
jgi:hypothetical protein